MINSREEADTSSLLLETGGSRVLRQGSKKLWKRIGRGDSNCGSRADLEAETAMDQQDRISSSYNNLLNNQHPGYLTWIIQLGSRCFRIFFLGIAGAARIDWCVTEGALTRDLSTGNPSCLIRILSEVRRLSAPRIPSGVTDLPLAHLPLSI